MTLSQLDSNMRGRLSGVRILIGEDCPDLRMLYQDFLEAEGAAVQVVANGQEVCDLALAKSFDILLMDINMPKLNGLDAARKIRKAGVTLPIVALTAEIFGQRADECLRAGCTISVHKPFYTENLIQTLLKLLPNHESVKETELR